MKRPVVVYWACISSPQEWFEHKLILPKPKPLISDFLGTDEEPDKESRSKKVLQCPAHKFSKSNMFSIQFPFDMKVYIKENGQIEPGMPFSSLWQTNENNKDKIRMSLQFRLQYIFFTEKNMELEILPPYLHKTEVSQYGHVASGKFNISKWFRAISIEYLLWPNTNMLSCLSSDVAMYLKFYSSIPVILKEFIPNEFIRQCANASASAMKITPKKSLDFRYSQFENSGLTSSIVKNIKGNLI